MKKELKKIINEIAIIEKHILKLEAIQLTISLSNVNINNCSLLNEYLKEYATNYYDSDELFAITLNDNDAEYKLNRMIAYFKKLNRDNKDRIVLLLSSKL